MSRSILLLLIAALLAVVSCSKKHEVQLPELVTINGHGVEKDRFERDFVLTKEYHQAKDIDSLLIVKQLEKRYLDQLYLLAEAYSAGIDKDPEFQRQVHNEWVTQLTHIDGPLYNKIMPSSFGISSKELKDLYEKVKIGYKVAHIKVADKQLADSLYQLLKNGASFDSLVDAYSIDLRTVLYNGVIPWYFTYGTFARSFEDATMQLKPGEISKPVKTNTGYHIIKLIDKKQNPLDSYEKVEYELQKRLKQIKKTDFVQDYISKLFKRYDFKIDEKTAKLLLPLLKKRHENGTVLKDKALAQIWDDAIVHFKGGSLNVGDIIYKYNHLPRFERIPFTRYGDLKLILKMLSVQELMYQDALSMELEQDPVIVQKVKRFADGQLLEFANKQLIEDKTPVTDEEVRAFYEKNKDAWKNDTFKRVEKFVRFRVKSKKEQAYKAKLLAELKQKWQPVFHGDVIARAVKELNVRKHGVKPKPVLPDSTKK